MSLYGICFSAKSLVRANSDVIASLELRGAWCRASQADLHELFAALPATRTGRTATASPSPKGVHTASVRYPPFKALQLCIKIFSYSSQSIDALLRHQVDCGSSSKQRRTVGAHDPTVGLELIGEDRVQRLIDAKHVADANENTIRHANTVASTPRIESLAIFAAQ